ncbi:glycosyltransferase [Olivibacter ginsenosidimutans]|uniref:glycosyltransferase n=1 Tax=Olivibacter ginsenosidimutans TaxID=1176537 RepID=UPI0031EF814A
MRKISVKNRPAKPAKTADYAIIVTAYEQTDLLPSVVKSLLELNYNRDGYLIYIVADNCDISTLHFMDERVILLRPAAVLASNVKSHHYAITHFKRNHERLTIIDSDNLVHPDYLKELDKTFDAGFEAVQGVRCAKNLNGIYACLDEAGDMYYRLVDRKWLFGAGSSAALSGSGMAFTVDCYQTCLKQMKLAGAGFDKLLQYKILSQNKRIAFTEAAIVYDEKTAKPDQLVKQRARWLNTWFTFYLLGIKLLLKGIITWRWNMVLFAIALVRPPLFILLALVFIGFSVTWFFLPSASLIYVAALILFIINFYVALVHFKANRSIYRALLSAPKFVFIQFMALFKVKKANKLSVATRHFQQQKDFNR